MRRSLSLCFIALPLTASIATAADDAIPNPISWSAGNVPATVKPGVDFKVDVHAQIQHGWHLYSLNEPAGGPIATDIGLTEGDPAELMTATEGHPTTMDDPVFQHPLTVYFDKATFTLRLRADADVTPGKHILHVLTRYQTCSDKLCMPPHTDTLEIPMVVAK